MTASSHRSSRPGSHPVRRSRRALLAAAVVLLAPACGSTGGGAGAAGEPLPLVELTPIDGGDVVDLADIEGPAVINLWATWCVPCRTEIPDFEEVHRARGDEVRFVGINIGQAADEASPFLDEVGATYDQYLDPQGYAQTELGAVSLPTTVVVDADGTIVERRVGQMDQDDLDAAIDAALG